MPAAPTYESFSRRRRRFVVPVLVVGLVGSLAIALSLGASLSGFAATITNTNNTAASAGLQITETSGAATCNSYDSTATCGTIDKYGGTTTPMLPGGAQTVTVAFLNHTGSAAVTSSTLSAGTCTATATTGSTPTLPNTTAGNLCSQLNVAIYAGATATGTPLYNGSPAAFTSTINLGALAAGVTQSYTFVVTLPATASNTSQGQRISQSLTWTFNA